MCIGGGLLSDPYKPHDNVKLLNSHNIPIHPRIKDIYNYLHSNGRIEDLNFNSDILGIFSKDIFVQLFFCFSIP